LLLAAAAMLIAAGFAYSSWNETNGRNLALDNSRASFNAHFGQYEYKETKRESPTLVYFLAGAAIFLGGLGVAIWPRTPVTEPTVPAVQMSREGTG
jgi:hypothetical protein